MDKNSLGKHQALLINDLHICLVENVQCEGGLVASAMLLNGDAGRARRTNGPINIDVEL